VIRVIPAHRAVAHIAAAHLSRTISDHLWRIGMGTTLFGTRRARATLAGIALALLAMPIVAAADASVSTSPACSARDLQVITLIEDHGRADDMAPERLAKAAMSMMLAREVCDAGRTQEALAVYDSIIGSLGAMVSQRPN
jgi:hypothetical protein